MREFRGTVTRVASRQGRCLFADWPVCCRAGSQRAAMLQRVQPPQMMGNGGAGSTDSDTRHPAWLRALVLVGCRSSEFGQATGLSVILLVASNNKSEIIFPSTKLLYFDQKLVDASVTALCCLQGLQIFRSLSESKRKPAYVNCS
jgi:hypothetical protein